MADFLKISDATALALHSMVQLTLSPKEWVTTTEIAEIFEVSRHHLAKVHQRLAKAGFIRSQRGPAGGVALDRDPATVTLLEIYELMEGEMETDPCLFGKEVCPQNDCMLQPLLPSISALIHDYFERTTLKEIAENSNWENSKDEHTA